MATDANLGLKEVVAMGVGGMVAGGIFAVLGVAMRQAGDAVPLSFALAGVVTLLTAYSYVKLTLHYQEQGGAFTFLEHAVDRRHVAGFAGWVLVMGYVGMMSMYAYAFGAFATLLVEHVTGLALPGLARPVLSVLLVAAFVALNLQGVRESGTFQVGSVAVKVTVLLLVGLAGIWAFQGAYQPRTVLSQGLVTPVVGFAVIFVAYQGFQLLTYDYAEIEDPDEVLPRGMLYAVLVAMLVYLVVSTMAVLQLTPQQVVRHKETALAHAVANVPVLGAVGFLVILVTALVSTAGGMNATLFGVSRLTHKVATDHELPRFLARTDDRGIPRGALLGLGVATAVFAAVGSLSQLTQFASIAFLAVDAVANAVALHLRDTIDAHPTVPLLGFLGTAGALPLVLWNLYRTDPRVLATVAAIFGGLLVLELLFIERDALPLPG